MRRADGSAVAVELAGDFDGAPLLFCHGLADSRVCVRPLASVFAESGSLAVAPDRPGIGGSDMRRLERLSDWVDDAALVLDALGLDRVVVLGLSGGAPFAAACAALLGDRVGRLVLVCPLGMPEWGTRGIARGERFALAVGTRAPAFGGWFLERLAGLARSAPELFFKVATLEFPAVDREFFKGPVEREAFLEGYLEAFRRGREGVAQDLRVLRRPWGFDLGAIRVPTEVHHGDADTTVAPEHAHRFADAIAGARLALHRGHGHFSLLRVAARQIG